ncbi:branched-chain amino acid ABC transporter permease [Ruegeria sp. 2205SS24-7]|uniref:branched-chain amino acid ABC transporter permease n=1 Tax=Ruegeria discodermiae TaxID=3064389 RepID=UPI002740FF0E|nr:branched-chain amino acid ABC transporter permease [Ruegeria sp. 2205SS24-7]MDP5218881.1 branched-chain amino acid ABC transporter permease [Ruegeria sp. 2205SS24-7]
MAVIEDKIGAVAIEPKTWFERIPAAYWLVGFVLLVMPTFASNFVLFQIFGWTFILGIIALSLMFLGGYGGMVSMAQMTIAGCAGYMIAIFGSSAITGISMGWPWFVAIPFALIIAVLLGTLIGWLAVRTEGIYTIMITLAIAAAFFYFTRQNYVIFNGFSGFNGVLPPQLFGVDWRGPIAFYYLTLFWAALCYFAVLYISRAPFGLALQGVRDNQRRMSALGYNATAHRVAAYAFAALLAGIGGILLTWQSAQISPGTAGIGPAIDILVVAVIGGMRHPIGAFIGAFIYVILKTFALDALVALGLSGERFQLLIGLGFLVIVFWSPDGILGLWEKWKESRNKDPLVDRGGDAP